MLEQVFVFKVIIMNKLIPYFIIPCTFIFYLFDITNINNKKDFFISGISELSGEAEEATAPRRLITEVNNYRRRYGIPKLRSSSVLNHAAMVRCTELLDRMSHTRPDGRSCNTVYRELGIHVTVWGENLAAGQYSSKETVADWFNSPAHRANLLNKNFSRCGIARITCNRGYRTYWVMLFTN